MTPLRITWRLLTPVVVPDSPIHLDGLLSWARVQEAMEAGDNIADPFEHQHDIPLERLSTDLGWCFKASWLRFNWSGQPRTLHYVRRSEPVELATAFREGLLGKRQPQWQGATGHTKGYSLVLQERLVDQAEAFAIGEPERISQLLQRISSLGKLRRLAKGLVSSVDVQRIELAHCQWWMRNLPADFDQPPKQCALSLGRLFSPYWSSQRGTVLIPLDHSY